MINISTYHHNYKTIIYIILIIIKKITIVKNIKANNYVVSCTPFIKRKNNNCTLNNN